MTRERLARATRARGTSRAPLAMARLAIALALLVLPGARVAVAAEVLTPQQHAQHRAPAFDPRPGVPMRVRITPAPARVGQALVYRGSVLVTPSVKARFEPPRSGGPLTWSNVRAGRSKRGLTTVAYEPDSVWIEARLQIFDTGPVAIPGPVVQLSALPGTVTPGSTRLPMVRIVVLPTLTAADSNAELRALHGPLAAPWWERLPWPLIVAGAVLGVALVLLIRALRRRKPRVVPRAAPSVTPARPRLDPAAEALRAIAALRARGLPAAGRFGEHALELTAILRRFLELTLNSPRPGDTSGELLVRLRATRVPEDDIERLAGLLALWDRVKFARAPLTEAEAARCEDAVEAYVRRVAQARADAANAARAAEARAAAASAGGPARSGPPPPAPEAA